MSTIDNKKWSNERIACLQCGAKRGFAPLQDSVEHGFCFSCGYKHFEREGNRPAVPYQPAMQQVGKKYINDDVVFASLEYLHAKECVPDIAVELYEQVERAGIQEYDGGMARQQSNIASGLYEAIVTAPVCWNMVHNLPEISHVHPFAAWLIGCTSPTVLDDWNIGLLDANGVRYWYQDRERRFVNAKVLYYDSTGHRRKDRAPRFEYVKKDGFTTCLYGEHQLSRFWSRFTPSTPVILVESEKTAVMLSYRLPQYICLATGGASSLTVEKASMLMGRKVVIAYDADEAGRRNAEGAKRILKKVGAIPKNIDLFGKRNDGYDLADWVSDYMESGGSSARF